ncbi:hypothetical protein [Streptomyces europaeiscabiei]|uniref:hypothetical protein n=1 Tax=Streptomyces europaeiscabiei TaxID=146819 RepID=UPI0029B57E74|nr:hypothetical protein [Streptomyces europaeiscabiei]MDX3585123.1 hypothetical protein [Streptomyces europaeiscabiei]
MRALLLVLALSFVLALLLVLVLSIVDRRALDRVRPCGLAPRVPRRPPALKSL